MKSFPTENIRNVVLLGHSGSGKTTLAEALLTRSGHDHPRRQGRRRQQHARHGAGGESPDASRISLAIAPFEWTASNGQSYKVNLIDCPGYPDFVGEVQAALSIADLAVIVVSAVEGVEVQTELLWRAAAERGLPRMVFVNKDDKDRADFHAVIDQLRVAFGSGFAPLELPLGRGGHAARHRRRAQRGGLRLRAGRHPSHHRDARRRRRGGARAARLGGRGDRLGRRRAARALPVRRGAHRLRTGGRPRPRSARPRGVPGARRLGAHRCRHRPPRRLHLRDRPVTTRPPRLDHRRRPSRSTSRRTPPASRWSTCSRRSPTRSSVSCRCSRCSPAPCAPTTA